MKDVLITGATGMLGAHLAHRLIADGLRVHALLRAGSNTVRLQHILPELVIHYADLTDSAAVTRAVENSRPVSVYHLASTPFNPPTCTPFDHCRVNVLGTLSLLEALKTSPHVKLIFTGTAAVYEAKSNSVESEPLQPATLLGASKAAASILLQAYSRLHGLHVCELRLFTPYGPWEHPRRLIPQAILAGLANERFAMSQGMQQRDYVYVDDVVDALVRSEERDTARGEVFNIGSGYGVPVRDVVETIFELAGAKVRPIFGQLPTRPDEIKEMSANLDKTTNELGWQPATPLRDGLQKTIAWISDHRDELRAIASPMLKLAA